MSLPAQTEVLDHFHPIPNSSLTQPNKLFKKTDTGREYDLIYHRLELNLNPYYDTMSGRVTSYFKVVDSPLNLVEFDLTDALTVDSVTQRGTALEYFHGGSIVAIQLSQAAMPGTIDSLTIYYHGNPTNNPRNSYGREKSRPQNNHPLIWTLSQPYGASHWWPCKDGLSDKIDSMDLLLTIPKGNKAAGNGRLISEKAINDSQVLVHWQHRYPIATYLVAVAVTNYDEFTDWVRFKSGDSLPILNYIFPEYMGFGREPAKATVPIMLLFDSLFGPYPFPNEKYGHAQFLRGGGMEHQTMSFMVDWNFGLVAHELAHQWFGDMVTCGSWSDLWLNEGFATYSTLLSYHALLGRKDWIANNNHSRTRAMEITQGSVYVVDTLNVPRLFSSRLTYHKGAQVLHMLRWLIGDAAFYQGIRNYLSNRNLAYGFALSTDLQRHLELSSGLDLEDFFNDWVYGEAYPEFTVLWQLEGDELVVQLKQKSLTPLVDHYVAPVELLAISASDSSYYRLETYANDTTFRLKIGFVPDSIVFDPNYWILAKSSVIDLSKAMKEVLIYPNPAGQSVTVVYGNMAVSEIELVDLTGKLVLSEQVVAGPNQHVLDLTDVATGLYLMRVIANDAQATSRLFKH